MSGRNGHWRPLFVVLTLWWNPAFATDTLVILHSSEHHGVALPLERPEDTRIGGLAGRATLVEAVRREGPPVLVLDSGDILIGTALSSWFRGEPDIRAMNLIRYDGMVAGNHDFDYGLDHLRALVDLADFPILCTNLRSERFDLPCRTSQRVGVVVSCAAMISTGLPPAVHSVFILAGLVIAGRRCRIACLGMASYGFQRWGSNKEGLFG